jgi:hypothetical protein
MMNSPILYHYALHFLIPSFCRQTFQSTLSVLENSCIVQYSPDVQSLNIPRTQPTYRRDAPWLRIFPWPMCTCNAKGGLTWFQSFRKVPKIPGCRESIFALFTSEKNDKSISSEKNLYLSWEAIQLIENKKKTDLTAVSFPDRIWMILFTM